MITRMAFLDAKPRAKDVLIIVAELWKDGIDGHDDYFDVYLVRLFRTSSAPGSFCMNSVITRVALAGLDRIMQLGRTYCFLMPSPIGTAAIVSCHL